MLNIEYDKNAIKITTTGDEVPRGIIIKKRASRKYIHRRLILMLGTCVIWSMPFYAFYIVNNSGASFAYLHTSVLTLLIFLMIIITCAIAIFLFKCIRKEEIFISERTFCVYSTFFGLRLFPREFNLDALEHLFFDFDKKGENYWCLFSRMKEGKTFNLLTGFAYLENVKKTRMMLMRSINNDKWKNIQIYEDQEKIEEHQAEFSLGRIMAVFMISIILNYIFWRYAVFV